MRKFYLALLSIVTLLLLLSCQKEEVAPKESGCQHEWTQSYSVVPPTEEEEGARVYNCILCGEKKETVIPLLSIEDYFLMKTEPTCEKDGLSIYTSEEWGEYEVVLPAIGHDYSTEPDECTATCTEDGDNVYYCSRCEEKKREEQRAFGHEYVSYVHEGSCLYKGYTEHECLRCGFVYTSNVTDYVHDYVAGESVPGNCTEKGYIPYTCRLCNAVKNVETDFVHEYSKITGSCVKCEEKCAHDFDDYVCSVCAFSIREELTERSGIFEYGEMVYFGMYPQSHVSDETLIERLDDAFGAGGGEDRTLYGLTYVRANVKDQPSRIYSFSDGTPMSTVTTGRDVHYFRYDPIAWRRAEGGVLVADCILDVGVFQEIGRYSSSGSNYYYNSGEGIYANNWSVSAVRWFLSGEFYEKAFNEKQKAMIASSENDNTESGFYPADARSWCTQDATVDNVFLPSYADLYEKDAITDEPNEELTRRLSDYALCNNVKIEGGENKTAKWLLRSPGLNSAQVCAVEYDGKLSTTTPIYKENVINGESVAEKTGIVPALRLDLGEENPS